jgi:hypothetical protein
VVSRNRRIARGGDVDWVDPLASKVQGAGSPSRVFWAEGPKIRSHPHQPFCCDSKVRVRYSSYCSALDPTASKAKSRFQSPFMLTTVQPLLFASS